jgi:uncharacterized protein GlcG (DUF336 family)
MRRLLLRGGRRARRRRLWQRAVRHPRLDRRPNSRTATPSSSPTATGNNRFPIRGGTDGGNVAAADPGRSQAVLEEAFKVLSAARAQIRRPLDSRAEVSHLVVDTNGAVLGIVRSPDAPIFGIDVSLQKARTAMFFSSAFAGAAAARRPRPDVAGNRGRRVPRGHSSATRLLHRPVRLQQPRHRQHRAALFPGRRGRPPAGPLSPNIQEFNPFSTGLQSALVVDNVIQHVGHFGAQRRYARAVHNLPNRQLLANGIQIFPGSVPIYRGNQLVGGDRHFGRRHRSGRHDRFLGTHNAAAGRRRQQCPIRRSAPTRSSRPDHQRAAALCRLPVRAVPRQQRPECLPGKMTLGGSPDDARLAAPAPVRAPAAAAPPVSSSTRRTRAGARPGSRRQSRSSPPRKRRPPIFQARGFARGRAAPPRRVPRTICATAGPEQSRRDPLAAARGLSDDQIAIPDRWRLIETLGVVREAGSIPTTRTR